MRPLILLKFALIIWTTMIRSTQAGMIDMMDTIDRTLHLERVRGTDLTHSDDFFNEITIHNHILKSEGRQLYEFCYASPQNMLDCLHYEDSSVQNALIYYDMSLNWLPNIRQHLPSTVEVDVFRPKEVEHLFPHRNAAKFLYYAWWRYAARILEDMIESGALSPTVSFPDLSTKILSGNMSLKLFWAQYRYLYQCFPFIRVVYTEWNHHIVKLHQFLSEILPNQTVLRPLRDRYNYIDTTKYLLTILQQQKPEWYDTAAHARSDQNLLDCLKRANTGLVVPLLLYRNKYSHIIDYRDDSCGQIMRYLNEEKDRGYDVNELAHRCGKSDRTRHICYLVGRQLIPSILTTWLQHSVAQIMAPYTALLQQVRLFEDTTCIREWNRRLQGIYKDFSNFFPLSQKNEALETWISRTSDDLPRNATPQALFDYFQGRAKFMWLHLFNYLVQDLAYWSQELQKLSFVLAYAQSGYRKNKALNPFNPDNCKRQQTLYTCIASIHNHVYQMEPAKLTLDKHYILFGNLDQLTEDLKKLISLPVYQAGLEAYQKSRPQPYKEVLPARPARNQPISKWSPESSDEDTGLKRSLTTIRNPRQLYKAVGRALSEK